MELIARDTDNDIARMLDGYDCPAILVSADYRILAANDRYSENFGRIASKGPAYCYAVSHGYDQPCDLAGEDCPLAAATASGRKERVLHIHQTPRGPEHVNVEMLPITDARGRLKYFVELLKTVPVAGTGDTPQQMVGASPAFNKMLELISRVGPGTASVLLLGESGSGKELAARAIHQTSERSEKALVTLECAGLTQSLFESELFGHVKGAFTGANYDKQGLVEAADGGTLFLDEIGDIPYALQVKLLRLIETGTYRPVGSTRVRRSDFRLVSATHRNLWQMVEAGEFRQDLYFRINVFPIHVPSLGERQEDIPLLARVMLANMAPDYQLAAGALQRLQGHDYRGNIRELRNLLARAVVLAYSGKIDKEVIEHALALQEPAASGSAAEEVDLKTLETTYLCSLLDKYNGDKEKVAGIAGVSVRTLYRKLGESP